MGDTVRHSLRCWGHRNTDRPGLCSQEAVVWPHTVILQIFFSCRCFTRQLPYPRHYCLQHRVSPFEPEQASESPGRFAITIWVLPQYTNLEGLRPDQRLCISDMHSGRADPVRFLTTPWAALQWGRERSRTWSLASGCSVHEREKSGLKS